MRNRESQGERGKDRKKKERLRETEKTGRDRERQERGRETRSNRER